MQVTTTLSGTSLHVRIENDSEATAHVFDSERMPYLIRDDDGLLVLFGVNPPDPDLDYFFIEIPVTRPLEAGEAAEHEVALDPLMLGDHYSTDREPTPLERPVTVRCEVGWGTTPIVEGEQHLFSIQALLAWQQHTSAEPIELH